MRGWQAALARLGVRTPTGRDTVAAVALAAVSLTRLPLYVLLGNSLPYPFWEIAAGYVIATADLLILSVRRRYPRTVLVVLSVLPLVAAVLPTRPPLMGLGLLVAIYTVATRLERPVSARLAVACMVGHVGLGLTIAALGGELAGIVTFWGVRADDRFGQAIAGLATYSLAWLVGSYVQTRRAYAAEIADRLARLEREREERARAAVLEERAKIARELHDVAAHDLSAIIVQAGAAERLIDRDPDEARATLRALRAQGRDTLRALRGLVGIMRDADPVAGAEADTGAMAGVMGADLAVDSDSRAPQPSLDHLEELVDRARNAGMEVEVSSTGASRTLPAAVDLAAYRVVQESLTNSRRHAPGAAVAVSTAYDRQGLRITVRNAAPANLRAGREISDTGEPSDTDGTPGYGLTGMRERVQHAGGRLTYGPETGGWTVDAHFPLEPRTEHE
jgi:signal transduction histidine kinase